MPLATIASAICRISVSLMLQPKVFHVFQPIGGVLATPLFKACAGEADRSAATIPRAAIIIATAPTANIRVARRPAWDNVDLIRSSSRCWCLDRAAGRHDGAM